MKTEVIRTWKAFSLLEGEWNDLLGDSRADTVFLTWEWIASWMDVVQDYVQPIVITVRTEEGRLVGVAPFYRSLFRLLGGIRLRGLRVMADRATGAEYPNWILRRDSEADAAREIAQALRDIRSEWDLLWMPNLRGWHESVEVIVQECRAVGFPFHSRERVFAYFDLPSTLGEYIRSLTPKRRRQLRHQERVLQSRGEVVFSLCRKPDELPRFLEALFTLNAIRWSSVGKPGTFVRKPGEMLFYRRFAPKALGKGWLSFFGLECGGKFVAVQIGYVYDGVFHSLQEGFDPGFASGAGNVLRLRVVEYLIRAGVRGYDFLGELSEHKRYWTARERIGYDLILASGRLWNRMFFWVPIWPTGRFLREKIPA